MALLLFFIFLLLNGHFALDMAMLQIVITGIVLSLGVYLFCVKCMDYKPKYDLYILKNLPLIIALVFVVIVEVLKANFAVMGIIVFKKDIHPAIVSFDAQLNNRFLRTLLSNYITLTPGTITVDQQDSHFTVHCLDRSMMGNMEESTVMKLLRRMEKNA